VSSTFHASLHYPNQGGVNVFEHLVQLLAR
jgi:hypothetical protein